MNKVSKYLEENLIAYIGNKRRLLPLIRKSIELCGGSKGKGRKFLDLFAGSGSVSRLAKSMGFAIYANDWEYYSYIINKSFIELDEDFLNNSFKNFGGIEEALKILNNLPNPEPSEQYISKYYCPSSDEAPDLNNERMFWTNYNGKKIDSIRNKIENWKNDGMIDEKENFLLISLLLYESSTRSNTSGVFKGFHKGFGGSNGDALSRILKKIKLSKPTLINGGESFVFNQSAVELSENINEHFDIVYLDPPYNQHQYGSNYHLLNTIALNDKPEVNKNVIINGKKINKSAIRRDWVKTRSSFCYKKTAKEDFDKIIKNLDSNYIIVSYSTDGIIPFEDMLEILSSKGKLDIVMSEYVKFRGGKQSLTTEVRNIEFVLTVDTTKKGGRSDIEKIQKELYINKIALASKKTVNPFRAEAIGFNFTKKVVSSDLNIENIISKKFDDLDVKFAVSENKILNFQNTAEEIKKLSLASIEELHNDMSYITNLTKEDELYLLISDIVKYYMQNKFGIASKLFGETVYLLSKFNNKKNYIQGLKAIITILNMLHQTVEIWREYNILENANFKKFEKETLKKLEFDSGEKEANELKSQIGILYDAFVETIEKMNSAEKKVKPQKKTLAVS
ncbi:MAG TPA: DNA adenine methylase [Spirochaetota bacterium]|jgi:adenine-specific DNA-methyltransferase|nr:MAG: Modification methylase FokI [Spirochaetes bacterium ADurb.Bin133]HOE99863.1 DNA adenine methylase [Spirochaetota bacterium]HOS31783.1 DNA adenine methylase [Spirochaetota bacterium]HOS55183.1 DNA adenine methylase [Spirochaetota bacterium]HPY87141.1 DNA adenine methylase [Spirochaetota bacterium]